jgi:hypothetical protein
MGHDRDRDLPPGGQRGYPGRLGRAGRGIASAHFPDPAHPGALGPADRTRLDCHRYRLAQWLAEQPSPGRTATTWLGLDDPSPTATSVAHWLTARNVSYALSGDVAADLLAPWARPTRALVYADQALDLTSLGLTPAPSDAATLELIVPDDPYVLRDARQLPSDLVIAHPWRIWADTVARGNTDAANALLTHLLGERTV